MKNRYRICFPKLKKLGFSQDVIERLKHFQTLFGSFSAQEKENGMMTLGQYEIVCTYIGHIPAIPKECLMEYT